MHIEKGKKILEFTQNNDGKVKLIIKEKDKKKTYEAKNFVLLQLNYPDDYKKYFHLRLKKNTFEPPVWIFEKDLIETALF